MKWNALTALYLVMIICFTQSARIALITNPANVKTPSGKRRKKWIAHLILLLVLILVYLKSALIVRKQKNAMKNVVNYPHCRIAK